MEANRIKLHQIFTERFDEGELRTLCFHLEIDYETLPGAGKTDKARELIVYCERRCSIPQLIETASRLRPDISWNKEVSTREKAVPASVTFSPLPLNRGFIGRESELRLLDDELNCSPVVLIEGLPGIGKTFLAARHISQCSPAIKNKSFWLECQEETSINHIFEAFADFARRNSDADMEAAVKEERPIGDRLHTLVGILESHSSILCLDAFENAEDKGIVPFVTEFLEHCQSARLIICTRERPKSFFSILTDIGEVVLGGFNIHEAAKMLAQLKITNDEGATHEQIAQKTEGHPLAIKLFATLVRHYDLSSKALLNDAPELGESLEEYWLSKIYARLSDKELDLLERFSVYAEPASREAVGCVSSEPEWAIHLRSLQDKFLINQASSGRLSMHSLIRDFCRRKLTQRGAMQESAQSAARYYLDKYSLDGYNRNMGQEEVSDKLKAHYYLITAHEFDLAAKVVYNIQHMLMKWAQLSQLSKLIQISLETAPTSPATPWFQYYRGRVLFIQGETEASRSLFEALRNSTEPSVAAESIQMLANIYLAQGKDAEVIRLFEDNLPVFRRRAKSQQRIFDKIARVYIAKGEIKHAIPIYNQILHWQQADEDRLGAAVTLRQLAVIHLAQDDFGNAKSLLNLGQAMATELGDQRLVAWIRSTFGEVYEKTGETSQAIECYERALATGIEIEQRAEVLPIAGKLMRLYQDQNNAERVAYLDELIGQTNAGLMQQ